ncbi:MAG: UDP-N-acetylmuramoyl-L-alanyl-D-glutamate--2,6-diaminopimelate ligase, partial [Alphaproteobacteria bacterium]
MKLADLTAGIEALDVVGDGNLEITGISYDSRNVAPGHLFCALRGERFDGNRFVDDAIAAGAVGILTEEPGDCGAAAVLRSDNPRAAMAELAARFSGRPTESMLVAGITGTNGKTTVSYLLESLLSRAGKHVAVVGTVAYRFGSDVRPAPNTTPESVDLQQLAADFHGRGADALVMEVSSHALAQQRVAGVAFDVGLFTNLTPEHLDYHRDMESYFAAKRLLFDARTGARKAVINIDDPWGLRLALERPDALTCGQDPEARVRIVEAELGVAGIRAVLESPVGRIELDSPLLGRFNLANLCCAAAAGVALGLPADLIAEGVGAVERVPGR